MTSTVLTGTVIDVYGPWTVRDSDGVATGESWGYDLDQMWSWSTCYRVIVSKRLDVAVGDRIDVHYRNSGGSVIYNADQIDRHSAGGLVPVYEWAAS